MQNQFWQNMIMIIDCLVSRCVIERACWTGHLPICEPPYELCIGEVSQETSSAGEIRSRCRKCIGSGDMLIEGLDTRQLGCGQQLGQHATSRYVIQRPDPRARGKRIGGVMFGRYKETGKMPRTCTNWRMLVGSHLEQIWVKKLAEGKQLAGHKPG